MPKPASTQTASHPPSSQLSDIMISGWA